jgi:hypothetical protein
MQLFDTAVLNRVVETMVQPQTFFTANFFGPTQVSDSETIYFDVVGNKRRITPVVSPLVQGKVVEGKGFTTKSFSPAYLKDKRVFNPNKYFSRMPGERIGGSMTPAQRMQSAIAWHTDDQMKMLNRRLEVWAAETLRRGKCLIVGEDYDAVDIDFGRAANQTITLSGGALWSAAAAGTPLANLETWSELIFAQANVVAKTVVMDLATWKVFRADAQIAQLLSTIRRDRLGADLGTGPMLLGVDNVRYMGHVGDFDIYVYSGKYVDPLDNTEKDMLPTGTVLLLSNEIEGVQHYGAIRDLSAGMQPRQYFLKSWEEQDPSARYMLMQSAPLLVPYRPNASLCATVL